MFASLYLQAVKFDEIIVTNLVNLSLQINLFIFENLFLTVHFYIFSFKFFFIHEFNNYVSFICFF